MIDAKLAICAVASVVFHVALERGLQHLPPRKDYKPPEKVTIQVVEPTPPPPPPVEPPKAPEPTPTPPKVVPHEAPRPVKAPAVAAVAKDAPPPEHPAVQTDTTDEPVFGGVSMSSTSTQGTGPAMPVGNTTAPSAPAGTGSAVKPLAQPIAAFEATKMPVPKGQCFGKYTDEARAAGVEGTVVLDVVVGEDGRVVDVKVMEGLPNGLTEAAVAALRGCRFTPGEKDGKAVPVRVRGFKIHFVLSEAQ